MMVDLYSQEKRKWLKLTLIWQVFYGISTLVDYLRPNPIYIHIYISILLYRCTTWRLTKQLEKKLDGNYIRMLGAILNKSWRQHATRHQLYGRLPPIIKTIQVRRTRHAGHCWRSRDELISDELLWTPHMARQKQDNQLKHKFRSYVMIWNVALKTCQRRWTIGKSGERGSGIYVLVAQDDDDDNSL